MRINEWTILVLLVLIFFTLAMGTGFMWGFPYDQVIGVGQHFTFLARSFLDGSIAFTRFPGGFNDLIVFNGRFYWHLLPYPAMLLVPFVWLSGWWGKVFYQGYALFFITVFIFLAAFFLARKWKYSKTDSWWLAFAFCFASVYIQVAFWSSSWFFSQAVSTALLFWAILEFLTRRRMWLLGVIFGLVIATRFTAGLGVVFVMTVILLEPRSFRERLQRLTALLIPVGLAVLVLGIYNQVRFGDLRESGYTLVNGYFLEDDQRYELLKYGLFKLENVPTNVYYYFIKTVEPVKRNIDPEWGQTYYLRPPYVMVDGNGAGFFVLSPIFLFVFRTDLRKRLVRILWMTTGLILFFLLTYYWTGATQLGARYMLDLLPWAFWLVLFAFEKRKLTGFAKILITASALGNLYLFAVVWG